MFFFEFDEMFLLQNGILEKCMAKWIITVFWGVLSIWHYSVINMSAAIKSCSWVLADTLKLIDCLIQCHNIRCLWPSKYEHDSHMLCEVLVMPVYPHYVMVKEGSWPFYGSVYHTRDRESYSMSRPFVRALWHNMMYSVRQHTIQGSSPYWTL